MITEKRRKSSVGFVDLQPLDTGSGSTGKERPLSEIPFSVTIHIFQGNSAGYSFVRSLSYSNEDRYARHLDDISDFSVSLPLEMLDFRIVNLPFSDKEKLKKVLPFELENLLIDGSQTVVFDSLVLEKSGDSFDILVVCLRKEMLRKILEKLSELHIDPRIVTSIELQAALKGEGEFAVGRLVAAEKLPDEKRIQSALEELSAPTINLRTGPFAYTRDVQKAGRALKITLVLVLLLLLVVHAGLGFRALNARGRASEARQEMRSLYSGLFPEDKKIVDELYQMKSHTKELREKGNTIIGVYPLMLLRALAREKVPGTVFNEIHIERDLITVKGETESMDTIEDLKTVLSGILSDVSFSDIKPSPEGKKLFTVVAKHKE